jgi:8-oxo-dGTP pyrophosphatase MutT (NUDIX family)
VVSGFLIFGLVAGLFLNDPLFREKVTKPKGLQSVKPPNQKITKMKNPWKTIQQKTVYDNPWISISHRDVINPSGKPGIYGVVHFKNIAVGIVPLDENNHTWLVGQYRYTLDQYTWEIPEGGCPSGESTLAAAQRELEEETGIKAASWEPLLDLHTSNSVTDEYGIAYLARDLSFGTATPEETEELKVKKVPFQEAYEMVMDGRITDVLSMVAIMKTQLLMMGRD